MAEHLFAEDDENQLEKSLEEQNLHTIANQCLPGGVVGLSYLSETMTFIPAYGKGSKIYDLAGKEYIDYFCGSGPLILGHNFRPLTQAIKGQIDKGSLLSTVLNEPIIRLAEKLLTSA